MNKDFIAGMNEGARIQQERIQDALEGLLTSAGYRPGQPLTLTAEQAEKLAGLAGLFANGEAGK